MKNRPYGQILFGWVAREVPFSPPHPSNYVRNSLFMQNATLAPLVLSALLTTILPAQTPQRETLEYAVEWHLVPAGRARLSSGPPPSSEKKAQMETKLHLESTGLVSRLFHVNDDYTAELKSNLCAEQSFMTAHEAGRNRETKVVYDSATRKAAYRERDLTTNKLTSHDTEIPSCVHDIIGGLFQLRTLFLEPGKSTTIPVSDGKKSVMLKIEAQRREEIKTPLGLRKCIAYEVFAFNDVLYKRQGHLHVWLTDDARHLPVQIQIRMQFTIGTITLRLDKDEKA